NLLAYSTDVTGNRQYVLRVKDLRTGGLLPDTVQLVDGVEWASDSKTLYYVKEDDAKRAYRLYRHILGTPIDRDEVIYEEKDGLFSIEVARTRDKKYLVLTSRSMTSTEVRVIQADRAAAPQRLIEPLQPDREYFVDHRNVR